MKSHNFYIPERMMVALKTLCEHTGLSVAEHVRRAIDEYLKKLKP